MKKNLEFIIVAILFCLMKKESIKGKWKIVCSMRCGKISQ